MGIPMDGLIGIFQDMYREKWRYEWGAAERGCVDCSGAFVWAYRQYGKSITHGSNAIARNQVRELLPISEARPGMAAFKLREPGHPNYKLPDKYKSSGDLRDFYHIGLVDASGKTVLNAQSSKTGFVRSPIKGWAACGYLKAVDYDQQQEVVAMETYRVTAEHGSTVNIRSKPDGTKIGAVRIGDTVQAGPDVDGWRQVEYLGRSGWMMAKYLQPVSAATQTDLQPAPAEPHPAGVPVTVTVGGVVMTFGYDDAVGLREQLIREMGVG